MKRIMPGNAEGAINAPPSKSMMQRAVIASALSEGESLVKNPSFCDDALAALGAVETLGAQVARAQRGIVIQGRGQPRGGRLDCGESGTCMRMIAAVAALYGREIVIAGRGSLMKRPVGMIEGPLRALGAECSTNKGLPPIAVKGPMRGGAADVDGSESSQFLSGLLMALPLCREDSELSVANLRSVPYVLMTMALMRDFGVKAECDESMSRFGIEGRQHYRPREYAVEGDWSGAAFMLVAGALSGRVEVCGLSMDSLQADMAILKALELAGAELECKAGSATAGKGRLRAFEFDATDCPDLFPPLAALACSCEGKSVIHGTGRLRHKESDRAKALAEGLGAIGADIKLAGDRMIVTGRMLHGGAIDPRNDHRIAMAGAVAALNSEKGVAIKNEGCVSKSYPGFFAELEGLVKR
jgi:3-phosphoshikimate 1-carboxyvinyltransferase